MFAYHIDRDCSLQRNQIITLYKDPSDNSFLTNYMFPEGLLIMDFIIQTKHFKM